MAKRPIPAHTGQCLALLAQNGEHTFLYDPNHAPHTHSGSLLASISPRKRLDYRGETHGIPIGSLTSHVLANYYFNPQDQFIKHRMRVKGYMRYMEDLQLLGPTPATLNQWKQAISMFLTHNLQLRLHPTKQQLHPCRHGARYLGYCVFVHHRWLLLRTCQTFKARLTWFNHLLAPCQPTAMAPQRGVWALPRTARPRLASQHPRHRQQLYGLLAHGNHLRLRQQFYHQHAGALKDGLM